jgi:hypothetical protein
MPSFISQNIVFIKSLCRSLSKPGEIICLAGSILTVFISIGITIYYIRKQKKIISILIYAIVTNVILLSSFYGIMGIGENKSQAFWGIIDITSFLFLSIFLKVLLAFLIFVLIQLMLHPDDLSEFVAKIFGLELSVKKAKEVKNALKDFEQAQKQIEYMTALNKATVEFIAPSFEDQILKSPKSIGEEIRSIIKDILLSIYNSKSKVTIHVIPLTDQAIDALDDHIAAHVRLDCRKNINVGNVYDDILGIAVFRGNLEDDETVIILDARNADCLLTEGELSAASNLYLSISTIMTWAQAHQDCLTLLDHIEIKEGEN